MPGNKIRHDTTEAMKNTRSNRTAHRHLTYRHKRRGHRQPEERANSAAMAEAAHDRHQRMMVHTTGKPENMKNYEPGGIKSKSAMDDEDEFGGGRRRSRRHRRRHYSRRR